MVDRRTDVTSSIECSASRMKETYTYVCEKVHGEALTITVGEMIGARDVGGNTKKTWEVWGNSYQENTLGGTQ